MENLIRIAVAAGVFLLMISWEALAPRRRHDLDRKRRWPVNLGLAVFNMVLMRFTIGSLAYLSAQWAADNHYGLLNVWQVNKFAAVVLSLLTLDFAIYAQHIAMHKIPLLWRLHKVHHTDLEFDATTAVRFHPLEIVVSMLYKVVCVVALGANPLAVVAFEIILNAAATFNHSNVSIPEAVDAKLRWLWITPDMHRIHHSTEPAETDSNYGFSVPWWDRLCRTYTAQPKQAQATMPIGLNSYRDPSEVGFAGLLTLPFKKVTKKVE